ncbi:MAG TPA: glutamate racemase [Candidatus Eisenbacteria bacterium]
MTGGEAMSRGESGSVPTPGRPVAVFDSGIGGLTLVKALLERAPETSIVYFGDTARLPYGSKSDATIERQSLECLRFLLGFDPSLVVVACNTASSIALPALVRSIDRPVVGVIDAAVTASLNATRSRKIGIIGTAATIRSGGYERRLRERASDLTLVNQACPLFVPLVEEGWIDHDVTRQVAREYLAPVLAAGIDTLILGCTHYPLLKPVLAEVAGPGVTLIDTGAETAAEVASGLHARGGGAQGSVSAPGSVSVSTPGAAARGATPGTLRFFVSDVPSRFEINGARFLGRPLGPVTLVEQSDVPWYARRSDIPKGKS